MTKTNTAKRSSVFDHLEYDPGQQTLTFHFKAGHAYVASNVTPAIHLAFLSSPSLGRAFNDMFWGKPATHPLTKLASKP
jgi:KTSC domain